MCHYAVNWCDKLCVLAIGLVILKGQAPDPNTLRAQYLENG